EDADQRSYRPAGVLPEDPADGRFVDVRQWSAFGFIRQVCERTHLDGCPDHTSDLRGQGECGVEVIGVDDVEATQVFLRFDVWAVGGQRLAVGHAHDRCTVSVV